MAQLPVAVKPLDPRPWYVGSNGATNYTRGEIQKRAREILESQDYQNSLMERIADKSLPPAVETMLWHYAYGKPMEQIQLNVSQGQEDLSTLSLEELQKRAREVSDRLSEVRALQDAIPAEIVRGPWK